MNVTTVTPFNAYCTNKNVVSFKKQETMLDIEKRVYGENRGLELMGILNLAIQGAKLNNISTGEELEKFDDTLKDAKCLAEISQKQGYNYSEAHNSAVQAGRLTANALDIINAIQLKADISTSSDKSKIIQNTINGLVAETEYNYKITRGENGKPKNILASNYFGEQVNVDYDENGNKKSMYIRTFNNQREDSLKVYFEKDSMPIEYLSKPMYTYEGEYINAAFLIEDQSALSTKQSVSPNVLIESYKKMHK